MYKYFDIGDKWGKGFITHKDRLDLYFTIIGKIIKVISSKEEKIEGWKKRVGVVEITEEKALIDIKQHQLEALINKKAQLEEELEGMQNEINKLEVD